MRAQSHQQLIHCRAYPLCRPTGSDSDNDSGDSSQGNCGGSGGRARRTPNRLQQLMHQGGLLRRIQALMSLPAPQAAVSLGVSLTSLRALCRSVGIQRWPNHRPRSASG